MNLAVDALTLLVTTVGACIAIRQLYINAAFNRGTFWLELRKMFAEHKEVHNALRPGGKWQNPNKPQTSDEWAGIDAYMGLFEHCERLMKSRLLDEETFMDIYHYRLENLATRDWIIKEKLIKEKDNWGTFIALLERANIDIKQRILNCEMHMTTTASV
jgi:hypothetical protein